MIDTKLKEAIFQQVRLGPALLSVALMLDLETDLDHALTNAARSHRVEKIDLAIAWTELVLHNSQSIVSQPWRQRL
jgi:hypothetical protein